MNTIITNTNGKYKVFLIIFTVAMKHVLIVLAIFLVTNVYAQTEETNKQVYEKVKDSVVGVKAISFGERSGSGVILDKSGYILTSAVVVPNVASKIKVWLKGPKLREAHFVGWVKDKEMSVLKINPEGLDLKPIEFSESGSLRIGDRAYTAGNAFNTIINDDQPSFSAGAISGIYKLAEARSDSNYVGSVFETTAAVNPGMEGAPLINKEGKMVGMVTPNFSPDRWLGSAIPIDFLKEDIALLKAGKHPSQMQTEEQEEQKLEGAPFLGIKVKEENGKLIVAEVENGSPASEAGLEKDYEILELGGEKQTKESDFWKKVNSLTPGSMIWLKVSSESLVKTIKIKLGKK